MKNKYTLFIAICSLFYIVGINAQEVATFDDLTLEESSYWNGADGSGEFTSGPATFNNYYIDYSGFDVWSGFGYSNINDPLTIGLDNQYGCFAGKGVNGSDNYAVSYLFSEDTVVLSEEAIVLGFYATNSTWAGITMRDGDAILDPFGGTDGDEPDWFKITVKGLTEGMNITGELDLYLADFRFDDNSKDYILDDWKWFDLTSLGTVKYLTFSLSSSDVGDWGMNTPAYFCLDDLTTVESSEFVDFKKLTLGNESYYNGSDEVGGFGSQNVFFPNSYNAEWMSWTGWAYSNVTDNETPGYANQYSAFAGEGVNGTEIYAVSYGDNSVYLSGEGVVYGTYLTNSTYAAISMRDGDAYSKKFGGTDGNDPDWFKLTIIGRNTAGDSISSVEFYLADYRFEDNTENYIVDSWKWVDLSSLGTIRSIDFELSSTDIGDWGMNTPAYFCLDGFTYETLPEKEISFSVMYGANPANATIEFNDLELTTDINGDVIFTNVSPTVQMVYEVTGEGETVIDTLNGFITDNISVQLASIGVNENRNTISVQVYPSPTVDFVNINSSVNNFAYTFYGINGSILLRGNVESKNLVSISVSDLKPGVYLVEIKNANGIFTKKILKE